MPLDRSSNRNPEKAEGPGAFAREALFAGGGSAYGIAGLLEVVFQYPPQRGVIVDDQDLRFHDSAPPGGRGRLTQTVVPCPGSLSISSVPPCPSIILRVTARPRPVPSGLVV